MSHDLRVWGAFLRRMGGGFFIGVSPDGECLVKGYGEVDAESADILAGKLIILASQVRLAARRQPRTLVIH